jgi:hypothetical protein
MYSTIPVCAVYTSIKKIVHAYQDFAILKISIAELHHLYASPAPAGNFDAAPAPAPTLVYSGSKLLKGIKVNI